MATRKYLVEVAKGRSRKEFTVTAADRPAAIATAKKRAPTGWRVVNVKSYFQLGIGRK
jgi:hypothetical protein